MVSSIDPDRKNYLVARRAMDSGLRYIEKSLDSDSVRSCQFYIERVKESMVEYNKVRSLLYPSVLDDNFLADEAYIPIVLATSQNPIIGLTFNRLAGK